MPQTNEYLNILDKKRYGHISAIPKLCQDIDVVLQSTPSAEMLIELNKMLDRIDLPKDNEELFPHEVVIILNYRSLRKNINKRLHQLSFMNSQKEII